MRYYLFFFTGLNAAINLPITLYLFVLLANGQANQNML